MKTVCVQVWPEGGLRKAHSRQRLPTFKLFHCSEHYTKCGEHGGSGATELFASLQLWTVQKSDVYRSL